MEFFWYTYICIIGSIIGSFLNVCICRLPLKESVVTGRSHCPQCRKALSFLEMIPVFSYLFLRGKCRSCKATVSIQYPVVEALTACLFVLTAMRYGFTAHTFLLCLFQCVLIVVSGIDIHTMEFPDHLHLFIAGIAVFHLILNPSFLLESILGLFLLSVPMLIVSVLTGGFGGGDIKLCAVCGLYLGWNYALLGFLFGCFTAALFGGILMLNKKASGKTKLPFGPFLSFGFILSALYGSYILNSYLSLFR